MNTEYAMNLLRTVAGHDEDRFDLFVSSNEALVPDLTMGTLKKLRDNALINGEIEVLFAQAQKHLPPVGVRAWLFKQTTADLNVLEQSLKMVRTRVLLLRMNKTYPKPPPVQLASRTLQTYAPPPPPLPTPVQDDSLNTMLLWNATNQSSSAPNPPIFVSGEGGKFDGGGASGRWSSDPVTLVETKDDLGASTFS